MRPIKAIFVSLLLAIACAANAQEKPATPPAADNSYVVGPEDVLTVTTRDVPEATGEFLVRADGKITMLLVGEITVGGLTIKEIREAIVKELTKTELKATAADVYVNIKTMRANRIYVLGAVSKPGMQDWKANWRLTELISSAGGLVGVPEQLTALIWRRGEAPKKVKLKEVFIDASETANLELKPGDVINIFNKPTIRVYVTGKVVKPGRVDVFEGDGALEALEASGGPLIDGAISRAKINRGGQEVPVDLYKARNLGDISQNVKLEDGDRINIPENKAKVVVGGMVTKPGPINIPDGESLRLSQALGLAGDFGKEAKTDSVMLSRRKEDGSFTAKPYNVKSIRAGKGEDPLLQDGDVVFVAQSGKSNAGTIGQILGIILTGGGLFGKL